MVRFIEWMLNPRAPVTRVVLVIEDNRCPFVQGPDRHGTVTTPDWWNSVGGFQPTATSQQRLPKQTSNNPCRFRLTRVVLQSWH